MTKNQRLKALLKNGYFPEGLPPPFRTDTLSSHATALDKAWLGKPPKTKYQKYSISRVGGLRRFYAITNPIAQFYLSRLIAAEWDQISQYTNKSIFALDKIDFTKNNNRAITLTDFNALKICKLKIASNYDYTLHMDISRFYPTLYTHSIPWALHGKEWCKSQNFKSSRYQKTLGNRLDYFVRLTQEDQTLGIPIGPDTSRILSEILAVAVELKFQDIVGTKPLNGVRNYDDISLGVEDLSTAENYKFTFSRALNFYELQLNQEKTDISASTKGIEKIWSSALGSCSFSQGEKAQRISLDHFFSLAFDLAELNQLENVLNYAVKKSRSVRVTKGNWEIYEAYLLKTARANGTCIPIIVQILADYNQKQYTLNKVAIKKFITDAITRHAPIGNHSELAWSLFLAKALKIKLNSSAIKTVYQANCSVCALLTLDLDSRGLIEGALDKTHWEKFLTKDDLYSEMWLLAYEADLKGWLIADDKKFVLKDHFFKKMRELNISFYDTRKNVSFIKLPPKPSVKRPKITISSTDYLSGDSDDFEDLSVEDDTYL